GVFLLYQKGREAQARASMISRERKPRTAFWQIPVSTPLPTTSLARVPNQGTAVLTNSNLSVNNGYYLILTIRLCAVGSRVRRVSTRLKEAEARFADYITRDDCSAPVRGADPPRQKRAHAQRPASRADRRLDRRIWLHQPGA